MIFAEGQDPLDQGNAQPGRMPIGAPEPDPFTKPTPGDVIGAAFRLNNPIVSVLTAISNSSKVYAPEPGYEPVDHVMGTKYEPYLNDFLGDVNSAQTQARMAQIDGEEKDQRNYANGGVLATVSGIAAGTLDPSWGVPVFGELHAAADIGLAARAARGAVEGGVKSTISEAALMGSQQTRTPGEAGADIATNTILMGLIGGGLGMLSRGERAGAEAGLDRMRADLSPGGGAAVDSVEPTLERRIQQAVIDAGGGPNQRVMLRDIRNMFSDVPKDDLETALINLHEAPDNGFHMSATDNPAELRRAPELKDAALPYKGENMVAAWQTKELEAERTSGALSSDLSAAASDQRDMILSPVLPKALTDAIGSVPGGQTALSSIAKFALAASPPGRVFLNAELPAKQFMGDMAESALKFTQAARGVTASTVGTAPIDALTRFKILKGTQDNREILERNFVAYRGMQGQPFARARAFAQDARGKGGGKLDYAAFKTQVYLARTQGDHHAIPQVAAAAKEVRAKITDPILKLAQQTRDKDGNALIADEIGPPAGDQSFAERLWNKQAIAADPNGFEKMAADWYENEQAHNARVKKNIETWNGYLQDSEAKIKNLEDRIEGRTRTLEGLQSRQEEARLMNQFAYNRSAKLSQPLDDMRQKIRDITAKIEPHLEKLEQFKADIAEEREKFPAIKEADATIFKLIGAAQKLKQSKDIVDTIDNAGEFSDELSKAIGAFKGGIREASTQAKEARVALGAGDLIDLEKQRAALKKEIAPYLKELNKTREELKAESAKRVPGARGGAVFETKIRERGNKLADQVSGRADTIDDLGDQLSAQRANAAQLRKRIEDHLAEWRGKTTDEVKAALAARQEALDKRNAAMAAGTYQGKGERLTGADSAVDRAVRSILESDKDMSRQELESRARETRNRINAAPDGRLPYDVASHYENDAPKGAENPVRGSLNGREFAIPTSTALKYIHTDMEHTVPAFLRTVLPDIHLTDRFGDVLATQQFKKVDEAYDALTRKETDPKKLKAIDDRRKGVIRDLAATRDRIRGVYGLPTTETQRNIGRVARAVGNWNVGAFLGTSMLNRMQDMANATARRGLLGYMRDGFLPYMGGLMRVDAAGAAQRQAMKDLALGTDTTMGHVASNYWDVVNDHLPGNRFERGLSASAQTAMIATGHAPWTDMNKQIAGMAAAKDFLRMADRIAAGTQSERDIRAMAHAGIDPAMAQRISKAFNDGGYTEVGDEKVPNTADWEDKQAREMFEVAIHKDANIAVITPGMEKPLFMSEPALALLGQFKSFSMAAQERIMISNMQEADGRTLQGFLHMLAMGELSYAAYSLATDRPMSDRPQDHIKEAVTRAAMTGWMSDINAAQAKFTGGATDAWRLIGADRPLTRHTSQSALEEMLGPTYALANGMAQSLTDMSFHAWSAQDTHKMRQAMFLQNHFLIRGLLDKAEDGFNEAIGVKPLNRDPSQWPGGKQP